MGRCCVCRAGGPLAGQDTQWRKYGAYIKFESGTSGAGGGEGSEKAEGDVGGGQERNGK